MLKPGDVVLDCGANVGAVTRQLLTTGAHVHAFEPDPWAFDELRKNVGDSENVTLHNAAVGANKGTIRLMRATDFDENPRGQSVKSTTLQGGRKIDEADGNAIEVDLVCLPDTNRDIAAAHGEVAFVKMDIEGAELELLEAMEEQGLFDLVRLTVAETHEHKFKELRPRFKDLRKKVSAKYPLTKVNLDWI